MQFNEFDVRAIDSSVRLLRAISHKLRIGMLNYIETNQPVPVYRIHSELKLEQSITSQHLKILREADVVKTQRNGKQIYYEINSEKLTHTLREVSNFDKATIALRRKSKK